MSPDPQHPLHICTHICSAAVRPLLLFWKSSSCGAGLVPVLNSQRAHPTAGWETCWKLKALPVQRYLLMNLWKLVRGKRDLKLRQSECLHPGFRSRPDFEAFTKAELWGRLGAPLWWTRGADRCWEMFIVPLLFQEFFHYSVGCILILIASIIASANSRGVSALVAGSVRKRTTARLALCHFAADQLRVAPADRVLPLITQDVTLSSFLRTEIWSCLNFSELSAIRQ